MQQIIEIIIKHFELTIHLVIFPFLAHEKSKLSAGETVNLLFWSFPVVYVSVMSLTDSEHCCCLFSSVLMVTDDFPSLYM